MDVGVDHVQGEPEGFPELSKALPEGISLFLMSFLDVFSFFFQVSQSPNVYHQTNLQRGCFHLIWAIYPFLDG